MGVIKKILYRNNVLGKPRHRDLFLDMEENIHIHYRDLRIELSRAEFEEIVNTFQKQSEELLAIIHEKSYQDGKLPNANQDDVRIWTESRLKSEVKYHPQRLSLEECTDGYHLHYRNYKILIDPTEFRQIAQLFKTLDVDSPYAASYEEVLALMEANDIDFLPAPGNAPGKTLSIYVAKYHAPKVRELFKQIGFTEEVQGSELYYQGTRFSVQVKVKVDGQRSSLDYKRVRGSMEVVQLVEYLSRNGGSLDPNDLNRIKCQVLDLYFALMSGQYIAVETDPQAWIYASANKKIIFPYSAAGVAGKDAAEALYQAWNALLNSYQLGFVKPAKRPFDKAQQTLLLQQVMETLKKEVESVPAVEKIYLMGSALRSEMGRYVAPFINGKLAKLGSDIDILVEINPQHESEIPQHWHLMYATSANYCPVYHICQIPIAGGVGEFPGFYPHVNFIQHLVDAYVFFPTRGHAEEKDAFLQKFKAKLVYDRSGDGAVKGGEEEKRIASRISQLYPFKSIVVEKMAVPTQNALYWVTAEQSVYVLKFFKVAGNYNRERVAEHVEYEARLINQLRERGVKTAGVIPSLQGDVVEMEGLPALLFEHLPGTVCHRPEYPTEKSAVALAEIHRVQLVRPLDIAENFLFEGFCEIWMGAFLDFAGKTSHGAEIAAAFAKLIPLSKKYEHAKDRARLFARSASVHNHGDVKPLNVMVDERGEVCFFDFNNALYGPRMSDLVVGAFEFSLAEKYTELIDFTRFDTFIAHYDKDKRVALTAKEREDMPQWIGLVGIAKFTKEIRVLLESDPDGVRKARALAIAEFVLSRTGAQ